MSKRRRASDRLASLRRTFRSISPEAFTYWEEVEPELIAYLEIHYQDWDAPQQETSQRRCK